MLTSFWTKRNWLHCEIRSSPVLSVSLHVTGEYAEGEELLVRFDELTLWATHLVCCQADAANTNPYHIRKLKVGRPTDGNTLHKQGL